MIVPELNSPNRNSKVETEKAEVSKHRHTLFRQKTYPSASKFIVADLQLDGLFGQGPKGHETGPVDILNIRKGNSLKIP